MSVACHNVITYCTFSLSTTPNLRGRGMMLVLPDQRCFIRIFQVGFMFSVSPAILVSSTYTDKNSPFAHLTKRHSQFGTFPNRILMELFQIAFPRIVLPKNDRTGSFLEERLGLPYWTMILAICASVDVPKYQDILTLDFFN